MCIKNVLDGLMAWYWRNLANGPVPVTPAREMVRHSDTGDQAGWPGVKLIPTQDLKPIPEFKEKMISFDCINIIMNIIIVTKPVTNICCHGCDAKFAPWLTQTSSRSLAWSPRHESQVRFVTELQSTNTGPGADCWHPPPWQGVGAACVCYKDQQMVSADTADRSDSWGVDQTFQLWMAAWWIFDICGHL